MYLRSAGFARHPQSVWWRRALFQVHLWIGLGFGLYIIAVSLSGSAIVFRREMDRALCPQIIMVTPSGPRMTDAQIASVARRAFRRAARQRAQIVVRGPAVPGAAVEVWYIFRGNQRFEQLFDPYTGKDLGDTVACEPKFVSWIADLHDNLLGDATGLAVNGIGAALLTLMCLSGAILWWPGTARWRRSLVLHSNVNWRRFVWDLHSVLGFWLFALILMWAVSAIYQAYPNSFYDVGDFLVAHGAGPATPHRMDVLIDWLARLHFGRAFGLWVKMLWVLLGLAPCAMIVTGALMWWNRVVRRAMGRSGEPASTAVAAEPATAAAAIATPAATSAALTAPAAAAQSATTSA